MRLTADDLPRCDHEDCTAECEDGALFCAAHRNDPTFNVFIRHRTAGANWVRDAASVSEREARRMVRSAMDGGYDACMASDERDRALRALRLNWNDVDNATRAACRSGAISVEGAHKIQAEIAQIDTLLYRQIRGSL